MIVCSCVVESALDDEPLPCLAAVGVRQIVVVAGTSQLSLVEGHDRPPFQQRVQLLFQLLALAEPQDFPPLWNGVVDGVDLDNSLDGLDLGLFGLVVFVSYCAFSPPGLSVPWATPSLESVGLVLGLLCALLLMASIVVFLNVGVRAAFSVVHGN